MAKVQICAMIDEVLYNELKQQAMDVGLPLSKVIVLRLKGYTITKKGDDD